jgi:hypothetical protein
MYVGELWSAFYFLVIANLISKRTAHCTAAARVRHTAINEVDASESVSEYQTPKHISVPRYKCDAAE